MKHAITLFSFFVITAAFVSCADGPLDYECTVEWCTVSCDEAGSDEIVGTMKYNYNSIDDSSDAVAMCSEDQEADRPSDATAHSCDCESK